MRCEEQAGAVEDYDPEELVCGGCSDVSRAQVTIIITVKPVLRGHLWDKEKVVF